MYTHVFLKEVFRDLRVSKSDMSVNNLDMFMWPSKFYRKAAAILIN